MKLKATEIGLDAETSLLIRALVIAMGKDIIREDDDPDEIFEALFGGICAVLSEFRELPDDASFTYYDWCNKMLSFAVMCAKATRKGESIVTIQEQGDADEDGRS